MLLAHFIEILKQLVNKNSQSSLRFKQIANKFVFLRITIVILYNDYVMTFEQRKSNKIYLVVEIKH